jgi:hypothetical protein
MAEIIDVANAMFRDRNKWKDITDEDKQKFFFIFNRYFSKKFPDKSKLLNDKLINTISAMDLWFLFMQDKSYPKWFWSKSNSSKTKPDISDKEISYLLQEHDLKREDLEILMKFYPDIVKEEVKYYRDAQKENK